MSMHCNCRPQKLRVVACLGLLSALAVLSGIASCDGSDFPLLDGQTVNVSMTAADAFAPQQVTVDPGDKVRFTNADSDPHTATVDAGNAAAGGPNSDAVFPAGVASGASYSFDVPDSAASGTRWYYHCRFHGAAGNGSSLGTGMAGVIIVN